MCDSAPEYRNIVRPFPTANRQLLRRVLSLPYGTATNSDNVRPSDHPRLTLLTSSAATNFHYLTGFDEPDSTLILGPFFYPLFLSTSDTQLSLESRPSSSRGYHYTLYVPPKDAHDELWEGARTGTQGAIDVFGADASYHNSSLASHLGAILAGDKDLYVELPPSPSSSVSSMPFPPGNGFSSTEHKGRRSRLSKLFNSETEGTSIWSRPAQPPHLTLHAALQSGRASRLESTVERLRLIKSPAELALMRTAGEISAYAHTQVMAYASANGGVRRSQRTGAEGRKREDELAAVFEYHCALEGAERPAYVPVVASG